MQLIKVTTNSMQKKNLTHKQFFSFILNAGINNFGFKSIKSIKNLISFFITAYRNKSDVSAFLYRTSTIRGLEMSGDKLAVIGWPYIHNAWDIHTRLDKIASHYEIVYQLKPQLIFDKNNSFYEVINFDYISKNVTVRIDQAQWFVREGELVINIFKDDLRVASIAFTLGFHHEIPVAYIGAIQGIHQGVPSDESLEIYRNLTKDFEGLRPRSLLLEVLKVVLEKLKIEKMFAVSDKSRHHRHAYFGTDEHTIFKADYNAIWEEHNGVLDMATGFYELPMTLAIKDILDIPSKKRSMYKKRYEILYALRDNIFNNQTS